MTTALDTEHFKQRLLEEQRRVKEALDYIHEENRGQLEDDREAVSYTHLTLPTNREV